MKKSFIFSVEIQNAIISLFQQLRFLLIRMNGRLVAASPIAGFLVSFYSLHQMLIRPEREGAREKLYFYRNIHADIWLALLTMVFPCFSFEFQTLM